MGAYKLSQLCDEDIGHIYEYGIEQYGLRQVKEYIVGLHNAFELLARQNFMGLDASELMPELRRFTFESHMIFISPQIMEPLLSGFFIKAWIITDTFRNNHQFKKCDNPFN
tara:strand:- start:39 stop:371 length:333 start_codon:yes stop_codon:yes gene_type:complete